MNLPRIGLNVIQRFLGGVVKRLAWLVGVVLRPFRAVFNFVAGVVRFFRAGPPTAGQALPETILQVLQKPALLAPHLNALRLTVLRSVFYLMVGIGLASVFSQEVLAFFAQPMAGGLQSLMGVDITESVSAVVQVVLLAGFAVALPLIALEVWWFVAPGLTGQQRLVSLLMIPVVLVFFVGGMLFAYYLLLPSAIPVLLNFMGLQTVPRPNSYFPFVVSLMFWMGVAFEFPLVMMILARLGLITAKKLLSVWRYAIVAITVFAAAITTTTDPWNMGLTALPMIVLYFVSVVLAFFIQKRPARA